MSNVDATENEISLPRCANPECRVSAGGRCMEGFPEPEACPQFGKALANPEVVLQPVFPKAKATVGLLPSKSLSVSSAEDVIRARASRVIAIIGPHNAGKTSLIAGLYDRFQVGAIQRIEFVGSLTLHSFEQACHDSRAESHREDPHTERTERGDVRFFHLDLINSADGVKAAVLLGDRAGEEYHETRNDPDAALEFPELRRADVVVLLADGAKLLNNGMRHNVKSDVRLTLQAFSDAGVLTSWQRLAIVLTKIDEIRAGKESGERALADFKMLVEKIQETFGSIFAEIEGFHTAASPKSRDATKGEGLDDLLKYWMSPVLRYRAPAAQVVPVQPLRFFSRIRPII